MAANRQPTCRGRDTCASEGDRLVAIADPRDACKPVGGGPIMIILCAAVFSLTLAQTAAGQLSEADIAALREQGRAEGWTFTVGLNGATSRSLSRLCGAVEPADWRQRGRFDNASVTRELPSSFDWRSSDGCTPIRDQGQCGSCWAFGAVGAMEAAIRIHEGSLTDLSEQWLVSCTWAGNCNGGWHDAALEYLRCNSVPDFCGASGAVRESDFPYQATDAACGCPYAHPYCLDSWYYIGPVEGEPTVEQIKQAILQRGPVTVGLYVNLPFQAYTGGVFNACQHDYTNHVVVIVGWDDSLGEHGAWIVRNSWGTDWGIGGYAHVAYNCSRIGYAATYVNYAPPDCNDNGVADLQDVAGGTSPDCNANDVPDECEPGGNADCDDNGLSDLCEIALGNDLDCNGNHVPDGCDLANQTSPDCNANGRPDECEAPQFEVFKNSLYVVEWLEDLPGVFIGDDLRLTQPGLLQEVTFSVMNGYESQTILDSADLEVRFYDVSDRIALGGFTRTNVPLLLAPGEHVILTFGDLESLNLYLPQEVIAGLRIFNNVGGEMVGQVIANPPTVGFSQDRFYYDDGSGGGWYWFFGDPVANFYWEIVVGTPDCNANGIPDECDIAEGTVRDDNGDGIPDGCQADCNGNGFLDDIDLAAGTSRDCNANDTPDECEFRDTGTLLSQPSEGSGATLAQSFADIDFDEFSIKAWDDFTTEEPIALGIGRAFFTPYDWEGFRYYDFLVEVADAPGGAEAGAEVVLSTYGWGEFGTGIVSWDFDDALLPAGTWWLSVQATGGYYLDDFVYWYRSNLDHPNGSEHYLHNPGGYMLGVTDPIPASETEVYGPADLAFELELVRNRDCNGNSILDACETGLNPVITHQPTPKTVIVGQTTSLSVTANATTPLTYQWQKDGEDLLLGAQATYTINHAKLTDGGVYRARITCPCGTVFSQPVAVTVGLGLAVTVDGDGTVALDPPGGVYAPDAIVKLSATPGTDSNFLRWEGDAAGADTQTYVVMIDNREVTAVFKRRQCKLTIWVGGQGVVEGSPHVCDYDIGTTVQLEAKPETGWHFARWIGDVTGIDTDSPTITVTMDAYRILNAVFEEGPAPSQQTDTDQPPVDQTAPAGLCGIGTAAASLTALLLMGSLRSRRRTRA